MTGRWIRRHLTYANVVSSACLFLVVGGAVAWAAAVPPNSITHRSIRADAVRESEIKRNAVGGPEVIDNRITGRDVFERSLGIVPNARRVGGVPLSGIVLGRADNDGGCDPNVNLGPAGDATCASFSGPLPREASVLLMATLAWHTRGDNAPSHGVCQMRVDGVPVGNSMFIGELGPSEDTDSTHPRTATSIAISDPISAGDHTFDITCSEDDFDIDINQASLAAVLLSAGSGGGG